MKFKALPIILAALLSVIMPLSSYATVGDTTTVATLSAAKRVPLPAIHLQPHPFWGRRSVQVGAGLVGAGVVLSSADLQTRQLRQDYLPTFRYKYDDYLQFAPAVAAVAMKALGVESRSSWERMVVSDALAVGSMLSVVYVVKFGLGRLRPDGSTHNSFPSGHTAMAFTSATILHKEYGHLSPWVSIVGYSTAAVTGISRSLNNRHWLSDIVVGAGVGILSTELGYLLADKIFKDRGLIRPSDDEWTPVRVGRNPSFVGVGIMHNALIWDRSRFDRLAPSGVGFNIEGAWFWGEHLGVGGEFTVGRYADLIDKGAIEGAKVEEPQPLNSLSLKAGLYYNHPLAERWSLGAKTLVGVAKNHHLKSSVIDTATGVEVATITHNTTEHFSASTGAWLRYIAADNLGVRLFAEYNWLRNDYTITPSLGGGTTHSHYRHPLSFGIAVDAMLW